MKLGNELKKYIKGDKTWYVLKSYIEYESGKRFYYSTLFLRKKHFKMLGGE